MFKIQITQDELSQFISMLLTEGNGRNDAKAASMLSVIKEIKGTFSLMITNSNEGLEVSVDPCLIFNIFPAIKAILEEYRKEQADIKEWEHKDD